MEKTPEQIAAEKKASEGQEVSYKQVVELLKDPNELKAAAARLGLAVVNPADLEKKGKPAASDIKAPEDITLEENATPDVIAGVLNKALKEHSKYISTLIMDKFAAQEKASIDEKTRSMANSVQKFAKDHPNTFEQVKNDMNRLWRPGDDLEDTYKKACKLNDVEPEGESNGESRKKFAPPSAKSPKVRESSEEDKGTETFKTTIDAAKHELNDYLANNPEAEELISAEVE